MQYTASTILALAGAASAAQHVVMVADGGLNYKPASLTAAMGDTVLFVFNPQNHSVTESTFDKPCSAMSGGFSSGFVPVSASDSQQGTFTYTVTDTKPHWYYCGQARHCPSGMAAVINPPSGETSDSFITAAMSASDVVERGDVSGGTIGKVAMGSVSSGSSSDSSSMASGSASMAASSAASMMSMASGSASMAASSAASMMSMASGSASMAASSMMASGSMMASSAASMASGSAMAGAASATTKPNAAPTKGVAGAVLAAAAGAAAFVL